MSEHWDIYADWNPWHGCTKISPGCKYCYVYRQDEMYGSTVASSLCRKDLYFYFFTKRIHRLKECLPPDWGDGYDNVLIGCTVENQQMADFRLPIFKSLSASIRQEPGFSKTEYFTAFRAAISFPRLIRPISISG